MALSTSPLKQKIFRPFSLHTRLILSHVLVTLVSVVLISIFAREAIFRAAREDAEHLMEDLAFSASKALEDPMSRYLAGETSLDDLNQTTARLLGERHNMDYTLYLSDGSFLLDSDPSLTGRAAPTSPEALLALKNELGESDTIRPDERGIEMIFVAFRIGHDQESYGVLGLRTPLEPALDPARRYFYRLLFAAVLVIIGVGAIGGLLAHSISSPVERLIVAAERFEQGELNTRVKPSGAQELQRLGAAFNAMAERLQNSLDEMHTFVANASHELRTPLTTVKLRVEALRAGALGDPKVAPRFLSDIEDQVDRLSRMVNDLLDLSRLESGIDSGSRAPLDLGRIATEVRDIFRVRSEKSRLQVNLQVDPNLPPVFADEDQIWRVLMNLLDNAISYTPTEGRVDLRVRSLPDRGILRVEVQDTGFGISPKDFPHIFERFYRTENTRQRKGRAQGSGIGLAIAKTIVENHGGKIGVNSRLGEGSLFWVELPVSAA